MESIDELERRFLNNVGWGSEVKEVFDRLRSMDSALRKIASCQSHVPGDVVDIAQRAIS